GLIGAQSAAALQDESRGRFLPRSRGQRGGQGGGREGAGGGCGGGGERGGGRGVGGLVWWEGGPIGEEEGGGGEPGGGGAAGVEGSVALSNQGTACGCRSSQPRTEGSPGESRSIRATALGRTTGLPLCPAWRGTQARALPSASKQASRAAISAGSSK